MKKFNMKSSGILFSIIIPLVILIFLTSNVAFSEEETGSIEVTLENSRGERTGTYAVVLKVFQDNTLVKEISDIDKFPFLIESLPINHQYKIEVHIMDMFVNSKLIKLNNPQETLIMSIPDNVEVFFQVFYNDGKVIPNVEVEIKSHLGNVWARDSTGPDGLTSRMYFPQSLTKDNFYVATFSLEPSLVQIVNPVNVFRSSEASQVVTKWPSLIQDLITIQVNQTQLIKNQKSADDYLVVMYDKDQQKIDESIINNRGEAFFSLMKVGTYTFSIIDKTEKFNELQEVASKDILLDGTKTSFNINLGDKSNPESEILEEIDPVKPIIRIAHPKWCEREIFQGTIRVEGTASSENGIEKVDAFAHTFPHDGTFPFKLATPIDTDDWSKWFVDLEVTDDPHRILVRAVDKNGTPEWSEIDVNLPDLQSILGAVNDESDTRKIAFVAPTFRDTVYYNTGFYIDFFSTYRDVLPGQEVTTDLNFLSGPISEAKRSAYFQPLIDRVKQFTPETPVLIIRDEDVHDGNIFQNNKTNAYDVLFIFHEEYVTQTQYDNFIQFLKNGGTIVMMNSNSFYAEILYDENDCSVSLVKGHDWEFDGNSAKKSVMERYAEENSEWFGKNFITDNIFNAPIIENNRFNYTWYEEDEVTNPNATILVDFKVKFPQPANPEFAFDSQGAINETGGYTDYIDEGRTVAIYELPSGEGKVLNMGIYATHLFENPDFLDFFEKIVLPRALGHTDQINFGDEKFDIYWNLPGGKISNIKLNEKAKSLTFNAILSPPKTNVEYDPYLTIVLPTSLIDAKLDNSTANFFVAADGVEIPYEQNYDDIERSLKFKIEKDSEITIIGTTAIPEFNEFYILIMVFAISIVMSLISLKRVPNKLSFVGTNRL